MGLLDAFINVLQSLLCGTSPTPVAEQASPKPAGRPQQIPGPQYEQAQQQPQYQQQAQYQQQPTYQQQYPPLPQQTQQQPSRPTSPPSRPPKQKQDPSKRLSKPLQQRYDDNTVNQANPHYKQLRSQAHSEGDDMARCFRESQEAYKNGDGARAKELSNEGKRHQAEMERLNKEAADWIFEQNNLDSAPDEVDLHGLYVKEAIERTERAILAAQNRGETEIRLIVGKGLHSQGGVAKMKPAIEDLMQKHQLMAELDPHNAGVLVVQLDQSGQGMNPDEIARRLEDDQCSIM